MSDMKVLFLNVYWCIYLFINLLVVHVSIQLSMYLSYRFMFVYIYLSICNEDR